jgi:uncharacterized membrane protein HdeD (DUF308 family)
MDYVRRENQQNSKYPDADPQTIYPPEAAPPAARTLDSPRPYVDPQDRTTRAVFSGGSTLEMLGGIAAVVLAILGLTAFMPFKMAAIAVIVIGVALLAQGGSIASRWNRARRRLVGQRYEHSELVGGVSTEVLAGVAGIVLGILALVGVMPAILLPVAAIVFGGSLLLGGAAQPDFDALAPEAAHSRERRVMHEALQASGGTMVIAGVAAAVLGILALLHVGPVLLLSLIAILCVGGALVLGGGALTAKFSHRWA